jgi:heme A synthase
LIILGLAHYNDVKIRRTKAPNRLKRIARANAVLATVQPILGIILVVNVALSVGIPFVSVVKFLHLVIALAIITQASSLATAYDMWEEKEYTKQ